MVHYNFAQHQQPPQVLLLVCKLYRVQRSKTPPQLFTVDVLEISSDTLQKGCGPLQLHFLKLLHLQHKPTYYKTISEVIHSPNIPSSIVLDY
jgi:sorbitol-specific phosphotransferase system component IIC